MKSFEDLKSNVLCKSKSSNSDARKEVSLGRWSFHSEVHRKEAKSKDQSRLHSDKTPNLHLSDESDHWSFLLKRNVNLKDGERRWFDSWLWGSELLVTNFGMGIRACSGLEPCLGAIGGQVRVRGLSKRHQNNGIVTLFLCVLRSSKVFFSSVCSRGVWEYRIIRILQFLYNPTTNKVILRRLEMMTVMQSCCA